MRNGILKVTAAIVIGAAIFLGFSRLTNTAGQGAQPVETRQRERILNATLQIRMFAPLPAEGQAESDPRQFVLAQGLGTLVACEGENLIVTHNHWGEVLQAAEFVRFHDAQDGLLLQLSGEEFRQLIRRQDAGTLLLGAPQALLSVWGEALPAAAGDSGRVARGDVLLIAHQSSDQAGKVDLLNAVIESPRTYKGLPALVVRSLDGQPIVSGDSGGGVWLDGRLVANNWGRETLNEGSWDWKSLRTATSAREIGLVALLPAF